MGYSRPPFKNLKHKIDVSATTITGTNDLVVASTESDVKCLITPRSRRFVQGGREEIQTTHDVYFDVDGKDIEVGHIVTYGRDKDGIVLVTTAVVEFVAKYSHPFRGYESTVISVKAL